MYIIKWVPPNKGHLSVDKFSQLRGHPSSHIYLHQYHNVFFIERFSSQNHDKIPALVVREL